MAVMTLIKKTIMCAYRGDIQTALIAYLLELNGVRSRIKRLFKNEKKN